MVHPSFPALSSPVTRQTVATEIVELCTGEYGDSQGEKLQRLLADVLALYEGKWPSHEACQVGYHTIDHTLEVALATARMAIGWNRMHGDHDKISDRIFLCGMAAALFHDSGYLKDKNDRQGSGGKYTFSHVERGRELARAYLAGNTWAEPEIAFICSVIDLTAFDREPDLSVFQDSEEEIMAEMVASADLIAQMADINYIPRLRDLHEEFLEAYDSEGRTNLEQRAVHIFDSFHEILNNTPEFYEKFVLPRLVLLNRMDRCLADFFAAGRNPYLENIIANISGQLLKHRVQWQRLGDILLQLGLVQQETIDAALSQQRRTLISDKETVARPMEDPSRKLFVWLQSSGWNKTRLGDILMEMGAVDAKTLRTGLLSQLLPEQLTERLTAGELLHLLRISLLAQNLYDDPWVFGQIIDMTLELLRCESGSLLLADRKKTELHIALHSGPIGPSAAGQRMPLDKGLSGWVFRHARAAFVSGPTMEELTGQPGPPARTGIRDILAVPLHLEGDIIGTVEMMNKDNGTFTDHDADLLTLVTNIMASALTLVKTFTLHRTP
ncbi:MAG: GAF domain-containing protein [Thermodesulfobacteriota bacterium]